MDPSPFLHLCEKQFSKKKIENCNLQFQLNADWVKTLLFSMAKSSLGSLERYSYGAVARPQSQIVAHAQLWKAN